MSTIKSSKARVIFILAMAIVLSLSMATAAFATGAYSTHVYKAGTYGTPSQADSMANGAVTGADYDGETLKIYVQSITVGPPTNSQTGWAIGLELDGEIGAPGYLDGDSIADYFTFDFADLSGNVEFDAVFTIAMDDGTGHPGTNGSPAAADLVVFGLPQV
jgi:hypothetical protein